MKRIFAVVKLKYWVLVFLMLLGHTVNAAQIQTHKILMTYWSDDTSKYAAYPIPGSLNQSGATQKNEILLQQLDAINVLAYAFLQVDGSGYVYFSRPAVDLSKSDVRQFCHLYQTSCPHAGAAFAGSFSAFANLNNKHQTLRKIISVGGAGSQRSFDNAINHPKTFIQSAADIIRAYHINGIDLDFEPYALFDLHQGKQYAQLVLGLRKKLGKHVFISIEVPGDWETLRSIDCPTNTSCSNNLGLIADNAYVSLMGFDYHSPDYPGTVTGNDSNLYSDPDEPLLPNFYHISDNQAIEYLTYENVPADRILLGFPGYFVAYGGIKAMPGSYGLYQPFDKSKTPAYDLGTKGNGSYRVAQKLLEPGFTQQDVLVNGKLSAVYSYNASAQQWITYDNPASVAAKADYVIARHLAGMMMWEIGEDMPVSSPKSLLASAHAVLFNK